ncbi:MAG: AraC family transcriptional regulator [Oxalicibacterium faecigallinarum]|uniref:AraC family transcriptional regulator n=1 Tax=Oxalicibacterium faecigallinarum TaxID=573741 RepID=UPI0028069AF0|nr:AraC family transcriptional regulator [Oxalicibacterium faecigallinarum]MDQ7968205.1 AraC family transcriptional regulator [Oxalicibacterium faecigallinarum]
MHAAYQEMADIIARYADKDGEYDTAIGNLFFKRSSQTTRAVHTAQWPCFALIVQGKKRVTLGSEVFDYGVGDYLMVSMDLPVESCITEASEAEPHMGLGMAIDSERLAELLKRTHIPRSAVNGTNLRGVSVHAAPPELIDAVLRLLRLLDRPDDIPAMAPLIEQEILYRLLTGPYGAKLLNVATEDCQGNRIARAAAWLRDHFDQPLRVTELAERLNMSVSSLHHQFKQVTAMTPMQYQKRLRLHEARRLMLVERLDVGTAGHRVGYESPSQFSREYARLYGQSPLRDIEGMRGRGGVPPELTMSLRDVEPEMAVD